MFSLFRDVILWLIDEQRKEMLSFEIRYFRFHDNMMQLYLITNNIIIHYSMESIRQMSRQEVIILLRAM